MNYSYGIERTFDRLHCFLEPSDLFCTHSTIWHLSVCSRYRSTANLLLIFAEPKLRRHAIQKVMSHLESRSPKSQITSTQALQLWRGFHVALYMHDSKSAISVQNLTIQLANTFTTIRSKDEEIESQEPQSSNGDSEQHKEKSSKVEEEEDEWNGLDDDENDVEPDKSKLQTESPLRITPSWLTTWSTAFWTTMIREWSTIDSHRMNKYLLLIRLVTRELFTICLKAHLLTSSSNSKSKSSSSSITTTTSSSMIESQLSILSTYPLHPRDSKVPNGLKLHMLDIYIDELQTAYTAANASSSSEDKSEQKDIKEIISSSKMLDPLRKIAAEGLVKSIRIRAREEIAAFEKGEEEE